MRIGVILSYDVYNIPTSHIVKELIRRGHIVDLYAFRMEEIHLRMFSETGIEIQPFAELTIETISKWDFIYSALTIQNYPRSFWEINKYIFHFTTTPYDEAGGYGDFTFTQRDMGINLIESEPRFERMKLKETIPGKVTGNPKYDQRNFESIVEKEKHILFVDSSHTPDSENGKIEEAKMLVSIARKWPDYKLIIKPRYFKSEERITHRNGVFLDECLEKVTHGNIPSNIEILSKHVDLEELSMKCELIITPDLTSTYCNVGAYHKKGLIASGFEFEYPRWKRHKRLFSEISIRSGLFVYYKNILDFIPNGKRFDEKNLVEMGLDKTNGAKNIVDTMERVFEDFLSKNRFPIRSDCVKDGYFTTTEQLISIRYAKSLYGTIETALRDVDGCNFFRAEEYVNSVIDSNTILDSTNYDEYRFRVNDLIRQAIIESYQNGNRDYIAQEYYIRAMYENGRFSEIISASFDAVEMFNYFLGRYEIDVNSDYEKALPIFANLIDVISSSTFEKSIIYLQPYLVSSYYWAGVCCYHLHMIESKGYFEMCENLTEGNHLKARDYLELIDNDFNSGRE